LKFPQSHPGILFCKRRVRRRGGWGCAIGMRLRDKKDRMPEAANEQPRPKEPLPRRRKGKTWHLYKFSHAIRTFSHTCLALSCARASAAFLAFCIDRPQTAGRDCWRSPSLPVGLCPSPMLGEKAVESSSAARAARATKVVLLCILSCSLQVPLVCRERSRQGGQI
jgi:hypothetical protein